MQEQKLINEKKIKIKNNNNNNNDCVTSTMDALSNMITPLLGGVGPEHPIASRFYPFPDFPP